jgi:hypothetical protein
MRQQNDYVGKKCQRKRKQHAQKGNDHRQRILTFFLHEYKIQVGKKKKHGQQHRHEGARGEHAKNETLRIIEKMLHVPRYEKKKQAAREDGEKKNRTLQKADGQLFSAFPEHVSTL